jgi:hypothetical protein
MTTENSQLDNTPDAPDTPPEKTWDDVRKQRDTMLLHTETQYNFDSPEEIINAWLDYKQQLRDIPETYKDLEDLNQIEWPQQPDFEQTLTRSRL